MPPDGIPSVIPQRYEEAVPLDRLHLHPANPNESDLGMLSGSLDALGFYGAVIAQESTGIICAGNHRLALARDRGMAALPVVWADVTDDQRDRILLMDNQSTRLGTWNEPALVAFLQGLAATPDGLSGTGFDGGDLDTLIAGLAYNGNGQDGGEGAGEPGERPSLADRFLIPPFDVLDARQGWWQDRKRRWIALGIRSELGRVADGTMAGSHLHAPRYQGPAAVASQDKLNAIMGQKAGRTEAPDAGYVTGTSIFDPVLCELAYRWFCPPGGMVVDPFAGGSVRGLVAAVLGRPYCGCDLSAAQVAANVEQRESFTARGLLGAGLPAAGPGRPLVIKAATLRRRLDCTADGIAGGCHGACCKSAAFWPPNAAPQADGRSCHYLGQEGCTLSPEDKPVKCLLYPLLEKPAARTLPLYFRAPNGTCKACYGHGPMLAEALYPSLAALIGSGGAADVVAAAKEGRDAEIILPPDVAAALEAEHAEQETGHLPPPRTTRTLPGSPGMDPAALTPVEEHGGHLVKRDDLFTVGGSAGGKARTCLALAGHATGGLVTAGSRHSPQVNIVATAARLKGLPCRVHVPASKDGLTPELAAAQSAGAEIVQHRPGHNSVIVARARDDAAALGWTLIPFGMECAEAVAQTAGQAASIARLAEEGHAPARIVIPAGSGMSMAGVLAGLACHGLDIPVLGVAVGADPSKRLDEYAPGWRSRATLAFPELAYEQEAPEQMLGGLRLDPVYEAKCLPYLADGDLLWVVGCRETARPPAAVPPRWDVADAAEWVQELEPASADLLFTCPPYLWLERYSDDPADLSTMTEAGFAKAFTAILAGAAAALKDDRFAVIVTGDARDPKTGVLADLRGLTIRCAAEAGLGFHCGAVLVTAVGSLPVRAGIHFEGSRILGRTHQDCLVFCKGDRKKAAMACGPVEVTWPEDLAELAEEEEPET